ncbi:uncharacterized protein LOC126187334 isoform X2 [Schistocerca cancellata]|uniref:uncharacterized protein LOC126187334 isoform X2 n=1 Tax=Schistocerca cancellata TaxID=274614 RepID=UPI0021199245|nr:uncharacterized protein LOC126187334 isoform X2 [Schistocerca cancellata]
MTIWKNSCQHAKEIHLRGRRGRPASKSTTVNRVTRYCLKSPGRAVKEDEGPPPPKCRRQTRVLENNRKSPVKKQKKGRDNLNARPLTRSVSKLIKG